MDAAEVVRFCRASDNIRLAYAVVGKGPPLVKAAHWLTRLDGEAHTPIWGHWIDELAAGQTFVRYDQRGCGLSDRDPEELTLDAFVRDLEAVVDDLSLPRFALLGLSQGGAVAVAYAARHPERVSHLVLHGTYARGRRLREVDPETTELELAVMRAGWGRGDPSFRAVFTHRFYPHGTAEQLRAFDDLQRLSTSADMAVRIRDAFSHFDVRDKAPRLECPVIVTHSRGDQVVPFEEGRMLASLIPGARFVPLPGENHLMLSDEPAWGRFVDEVRPFLGVERPPSAAPSSPTGRVRRLATVMFVDIVDSTGIAARLGDDRWSQVLADFHAAATDTVARHGGRVVDRAGDGFLAVFEQPTPAVRTGLDVGVSAESQGIVVRAGVHTGEVEIDGDDLKGIGVHIGARIGALSEAGEVWVSATVKELVTGSGLTFRSVGLHHLKGMAEPRELYAVGSG